MWCRKLCKIFEALQCKRQKQIYFDSSIIKLRISRGCDNLSDHFRDNQRVISPCLLSVPTIDLIIINIIIKSMVPTPNFKIWFIALKARQWAGFFSFAMFWQLLDRKSTRLNSSHQIISYAVFCLKKKKK